MCMLRRISSVLLVIGGLNWVLNLYGANVVDKLGSTVAMIVYWLVGVAALVEISHWLGLCKCECCNPGMGSSMPMKK